MTVVNWQMVIDGSSVAVQVERWKLKTPQFFYPSSYFVYFQYTFMKLIRDYYVILLVTICKYVWDEISSSIKRSDLYFLVRKSQKRNNWLMEIRFQIKQHCLDVGSYQSLTKIPHSWLDIHYLNSFTMKAVQCWTNTKFRFIRGVFQTCFSLN